MDIHGAGAVSEELKRIALTKFRDYLGDDHPRTLVAMFNLGWTCRKLGQLTRAEELHNTSLSKHSIITGEDHPTTLMVMWGLAQTYYEQGKLDEVE